MKPVEKGIQSLKYNKIQIYLFNLTLTGIDFSINRHVRRILCINYLAGFCPEGSACTDAHPRFELPAPSDIDPKFGKKVSLA